VVQQRVGDPETWVQNTAADYERKDKVINFSTSEEVNFTSSVV
jgi:hypothetical protein